MAATKLATSVLLLALLSGAQAAHTIEYVEARVGPIALGNHTVSPAAAGGRSLLTTCTTAVGNMDVQTVTIPAQGYYTRTYTGANQFIVR
jgi:hypothetical protein